ncbi:MAG: kelch repeat-containing protein [Verrucomicrobia bacterium]|nr:kelch repeat-containing protein [Verrucomicrobiota bacterium]
MKIPKYLLVIGCALFAFSIAVHAQTEDLSYASGSQGEDGALSFATPLNIQIREAAVAGDTNRNEVVVFGGYDSSRNLSSATWVWTKEKGWEEKFPENSPPARSNALMCYDSDRKEIILYGGWSQNGQLNDTWVWNGDDWLQKPQENPPFIDYWNSAMVYDATRKRPVIISPNYYGGGNMYFWDGTSWTQEYISMPASNIYNFSAAYDAKNEKIVLLTSYGETLLYDGISWVKSETAKTPIGNSYYYYSNRNNLAYDAVSQKIIYFGSSGGGGNNYNYYGDDTWAWDGANWEELTPDRSPSPRQGHAVAGIGSGVVLVGGWGNFNWEYYMENTPLYGSTEFWDGENWNYNSGGVCDIDMNEKEDGVWRYSSITIPKGMVVRFNRNERNSPVQWLASGHVEIDGIVDVSGEKGENFSSYYYYNNAPTNSIGSIAKGGVGGFDGGRGGIRFQDSGSYAGMPGVGPGGGSPGLTNVGSQESYGKPGGFTGSADSTGAIISTYGNTYLQPLVGGSGGGGSASSDLMDGVSGGGGGGAILIASTRDITINGRILANGGDSGSINYQSGHPNYNYFNAGSGAGSGGAIRLVADRVVGKGDLRARGGNNNYYFSNGQLIATTGRIRIEAYERDLANSPSNFPPAFQAPPIQTSPIKDHGKLRFVSVNGENVEEPSSGDLDSPDVVFDAPGTVKILVAGDNVADGTRIRVRITMKGDAFVSEPATLTNGQAEFNLSVPAGEGTIQAYSLRSLTYKDEAEENGQPQS